MSKSMRVFLREHGTDVASCPTGASNDIKLRLPRLRSLGLFAAMAVTVLALSSAGSALAGDDDAHEAAQQERELKREQWRMEGERRREEQRAERQRLRAEQQEARRQQREQERQQRQAAKQQQQEERQQKQEERRQQWQARAAERDEQRRNPQGPEVVDKAGASSKGDSASQSGPQSGSQQAGTQQAGTQQGVPPQQGAITAPAGGRAGGAPAQQGGSTAGQTSTDTARGKSEKSEGSKSAEPESDADTAAAPVRSPPRTVEELFRRASGNTGGFVDLDPLRDLPNYVPQEVVARDLDEGQLVEISHDGYRLIERTDLPSLGLSLMRLKVPMGKSAGEARRDLSRRLPARTFTFNTVHTIFDSASGESEGGGDAVAPSAGAPGAPCRGNRCYGRRIILWNESAGNCASGVKIGVIDTAFDLSHPAFKGVTSHSGSFRNGGAASASKDDWHGTAVLSLLAGNEESGIPGLVPDATYFLASAFRMGADGTSTTDSVSLLKALEWLDSFGVQLVNMSFTGPSDENVKDAIARMRSKGVVFVAAAGNNAQAEGAVYPAAYDGVIGVTAISSAKIAYRYANRGSYVDIAAPGVEVWTALPDGRAGYRSGTSFAAPFATALIAARADARDGVRDIVRFLSTFKFEDLGPKGDDPTYGKGIPLAPQSCGGAAVAEKSRAILPAPMSIGTGQSR
jgi:hypothetical protein